MRPVLQPQHPPQQLPHPSLAARAPLYAPLHHSVPAPASAPPGAAVGPGPFGHTPAPLPGFQAAHPVPRPPCQAAGHPCPSYPQLCQPGLPGGQFLGAAGHGPAGGGGHTPGVSVHMAQPHQQHTAFSSGIGLGSTPAMGAPFGSSIGAHTPAPVFQPPAQLLPFGALGGSFMSEVAPNPPATSGPQQQQQQQQQDLPPPPTSQFQANSQAHHQKSEGARTPPQPPNQFRRADDFHLRTVPIGPVLDEAADSDASVSGSDSDAPSPKRSVVASLWGRFQDFKTNVIDQALEHMAKLDPVRPMPFQEAEVVQGDAHLNSVSIEYSEAAVREATKDFDQSCLLGSCAFGHVYRGKMQDGSEVVATSVRHDSRGQSKTGAAGGSLPSGLLGKQDFIDTSDDDLADVMDQSDADDVEGYCRGTQDNVGQAQGMRSLEKQFQFNQNLVKQYEELSTIFRAWRPVRGDGNCYYRAVLFAWLERSLALGNFGTLMSFHDALVTWKSFPVLAFHVKTCRHLLRTWMRRRMKCSVDADVGELLVEVHEEFNKGTCDRSFIKCLRQVVAQYLREHAGDPVDQQQVDSLTYGSWITAITGTTSIEDYCAQYVLKDNEEAADLVQYICPMVLNTFVRICIVERGSADCTFVDYSASMAISASGEQVPRPVKSAREIVTSSALSGKEPEIFLLLKPGHYDILVKEDDPVARLLAASLPRPSLVTGGPINIPGDAAIRRQVEIQWRRVMKIFRKLTTAITDVMSTLDDKLAEELTAKRRRYGSTDETLFEGTLASVVEPLRDALQQLRHMPEDSPFGEEPALCQDAPLIWSLLPRLGAFFEQPLASSKPPPGTPLVQQPAPSQRAKLMEQQQQQQQPHPKVMGRPVMVPVEVSSEVKSKLQVSPAMQPPAVSPVGHRQPQPHPGADSLAPPGSFKPLSRKGHPHGVDQTPTNSPAQCMTQSAAAPAAAALAAATPVIRSSVTADDLATECSTCCFCMMPGAMLKAPLCSCFYHPHCLKDYVDDEGLPYNSIRCHIHDKTIGVDLIQQALSHIPIASQPEPGPEPSVSVVNAPPTYLSPAVTPSRSAPDVDGHKQQQQHGASALDHAPSIGPATRRQLDGLGKGNMVSSGRALQHALPIGPSTRAQLGMDNIVVQSSLGAETGFRDRNVIFSGPCPHGCSMSMKPKGPPASGLLPPSAPPLCSPCCGSAVPPSTRRLLPTGNLGCALGVPCVICFGEEGILKTLHCGYKAHVDCLKKYWTEKVETLCKITDIRCPAEVTGCSQVLTETDLRGVVSAEDLASAERNIKDVDDKTKQLVEELTRQMEEHRPMFQCAICLMEHEIEGCCTLPCNHRFCFESLQHHFDIIVRERRLSKLTCPAEGCGHNLRSEDAIHIFQHCLSEETYNKLLEFLTRDDPHIYDCKHLGCEERVWCDDEGDLADLQCQRHHRFCGRCENGPHPGISCEQREQEIEREKKEEADRKDDEDAWQSAFKMGWKPCPRRCQNGGGFKADAECDHVTCECGFEFCWDCGVDRRVLIAHDNRWHKPKCRYYTDPASVQEPPRAHRSCPECQRCGGGPCVFPQDDGYPHSYLPRRNFIAAPR